MDIELKFDPNQPRDEDGKFGSGGGGGGSSDKKPEGDKKPDSDSSDKKPTSRKRPTAKVSTQASTSLKKVKRTPDEVLDSAGMRDLPSELADANPPEITTEEWSDGRVKVNVKAGSQKAGFEMDRTLVYDKKGKLTSVSNNSFFLPESYRGTGEGTRIFNDQVESIRAQAGKGQFPQIATTAGKGKGMNGYYTWARLGYDAPVQKPNFPFSKIPESVVKPKGKFGSPSYNVSDFMKSKEGREFWKEYGYQTDMYFNTDPSSLSSKVLGEYTGSKGKSIKMDAPEGMFDIDIDDEEKLDAIWDKIGEESKALEHTHTHDELPSKTITLLAHTVPEPKTLLRQLTDKIGLTKAHSKRIWKGDDGYRRMLIITSNAYEDREGETITTKALGEWVERQWLDEQYIGTNPLLFWHDDRVRMGDIIFSDMSGSFLVEIAKEDDSPLSPYLWDYAEKVDNAGASHRFVAIPTIQDDTVFEWIDKEETTWLPREAAANELTYAGVLPVERETFFNKMLGLDNASELLDKGINELMAELSAKGVKHKALKQTASQARLQLELIKELGTMPNTSEQKLNRLLSLFQKAYPTEKMDGEMLEEEKEEMIEEEIIEEKDETTDMLAMMDERLGRIEEAIASMLAAKMAEDEMIEVEASKAKAKAANMPRIATRASQSKHTIIDLDDAPAGIKSFGTPTEDFFGYKITKRGN